MTSKKLYFGMIGMIAVLSLLIIVSVVMGDKYLKGQSDKLLSLKLDTLVVESQQTLLVQAKKDIELYSNLEAISKQIVPQDKDQAKAVREITSLADQSNINISNIVFPVSNLGQAAPAATPAPANETEGDKTEKPKVKVNPLTQAKPVTGIEGLYQLDINIISDASKPSTYNQLINFLESLENNRRTSQVSQITITPDSANRNLLNFTLTITVYIKP